MNKNLLVYLMILFSIFIFPTCSTSVAPIINPGENEFGIYLMEDTALTNTQIYGYDLNSFKLMNKPWLSSDDIEMYDFSCHIIYLKNDKDFYFYKKKLPVLPKEWRPYVVTANKVPIYFGTFTGEHYFDFCGPTEIELRSSKFMAPDLIRINEGPDYYEPISDIRIKEALIADGKYHGGLAVQIHDVRIINSDTCKVIFNITFTNNDSDNLYIFNPDYSVNSFFREYSSGPELYNKTNRKVYYIPESLRRSSDTLKFPEEKYLLLVPAGKSVTKELVTSGFFEGYTKEAFKFDSGEYAVYFGYYPPENIKKEKRKFSNGRLWMGNISSTPVYLSVE